MTTTTGTTPRGGIGRAARLAGCALFAGSLLAGGAFAPGALASEMAERTRGFVETLQLPDTEVEIVVGEPDPRLSLAPCGRYEPFVPPGARLWGRTSLGVRCVEGAAWTVYIPVHIKVYADAPVAARPIPRGQTLAADDVRRERVELTLYPAGALAGTEAIEGRVATRGIAAGEPLRRELLRARPVIQAGDMVRIVANGTGFAVSTDGKALTAATEGQTVQAMANSGRVVSGIARPGLLVEIR